MGVCKSSANKPTKVSNTAQRQKPSTTKGTQVQSQMEAVDTQDRDISDKAPKPVEIEAKCNAKIVKNTTDIASAKISETQTLLENPPNESKSETNKIGEKIGIGPLITEIPKDQSFPTKEVGKLEANEMEAKVDSNDTVVFEHGSGGEETSTVAKTHVQSLLPEIHDEASKVSNEEPEPMTTHDQKIESVHGKYDQIPGEKIIGNITELIEKAPSNIKPTVNKAATKIRENVQEPTSKNKTEVVQYSSEEEKVSSQEMQIVTTEAVAVGSGEGEFEPESIGQLDRLRVLKSKFRQTGTNDDNCISKEEFLAVWITHPSVALEGEEVFKQIDLNQDGIISLGEFDKFYLRTQWNTIVTNFEKRDIDNSLKISKKDFLESCMANFLCPASKAKKLFKMLDANGEGKLSLKKINSEKEHIYILRTLEELLSRRPDKIKKFHLVYNSGTVELNDSTVLEAFNQIDWKMEDRKLTLADFITYFSLQGVSKLDCKKLFANFKKDRNGAIGFKQFQKTLNKSQSQPRKVRSRRTLSRGNLME